MRNVIVPALLALAFISTAVDAAEPGSLAGLATVRPEVRSKRVSSYDRTGDNDDSLHIKAGATAEIFKVEGPGAVTHIWITMRQRDPLSRRNVILRMYWDGEAEPSVESPIGDFFGQGWGEYYNYASLPLAASPDGGRAMVSYFPMPFSGGARITIENDSDADIGSFYYYVDYEQRPVGADEGRFHAWWNHEFTEAPPGVTGERSRRGVFVRTTIGADSYLFMEAEGAGQFVGVNYFVTNPARVWYGEGDDMFFIDGEAWPSSLHGTGTEDYFNTAWCPSDVFLHPYFGIARVAKGEDWQGRTHCYRFHMEDPVRFSRSLRATIEHGHGNALAMEMVSVAYWYQTEPHKPFPKIEPRAARQPMPESPDADIRVWRDAWRAQVDSARTARTE